MKNTLKISIASTLLFAGCSVYPKGLHVLSRQDMDATILAAYAQGTPEGFGSACRVAQGGKAKITASYHAANNQKVVLTTTMAGDKASIEKLTEPHKMADTCLAKLIAATAHHHHWVDKEKSITIGETTVLHKPVVEGNQETIYCETVIPRATFENATTAARGRSHSHVSDIIIVLT